MAAAMSILSKTSRGRKLGGIDVGRRFGVGVRTSVEKKIKNKTKK